MSVFCNIGEKFSQMTDVRHCQHDYQLAVLDLDCNICREEFCRICKLERLKGCKLLEIPFAFYHKSYGWIFMLRQGEPVKMKKNSNCVH